MDVKLGHLRQVAISCSDLRRSIAFYRDSLGAELIAEFSPPGLAFFRMGTTRLLVQQQGAAGGSGGSGVVLYFDVVEIEAAQAELERRGVQFETQPRLVHRDDAGTFGPAGAEEWMTFFTDPDGQLLSLVESRDR